MKSCSLSVVRALLIVLVGAVAASAQSVNPTSLNFNNQVINTTSAAKQITLKNGQSSAITITSIASNSSQFTQTNNCPASPATLGPNKSCAILVTFSPSSLGAQSGVLTITSSGRNGTLNANLSGTGIAAVTATPTSLTFSSTVVGKKSSSSSVTVKNNQSSALTILSIASSVADFTSTTGCPLTPSTLAAGSTCKLNVTFAPTAAGVRSGSLTISTNASNSPTVALTGTGVLSATVNPTALSFGNQAMGTTSAPQSVSLTNNQSTSITLRSITSSASDFKVNSGCGSSLSAGSSCQVAVTFSPQANGTRTGTLTFTDSANNSPQTVALSGAGITPTLVSITVSPGSSSIALGTTQPFSAIGTYTDGSTQNLTSSVSWSTSPAGVAAIGAGGLATSLSEGATTILATLAGVTGTASLSVGPPALSLITVSPSGTTLASGTTQQFDAIGTFTDGSTQDVSASVSWSSSAPGTATISATGLASGVTAGQATISATENSITGSAGLTVGPPLLVSIAITPANPSFALGTSQQLKAIGTYTDGSTLDITNTVAWSTADSTVSAINAQGVAASVAIGATTATATSGAISNTTSLNVTAAVLASIVVTPALPAITVGTVQQFTATGMFTDGSTQDITATVQWNSDTPSTASISNDSGTQGSATAVGSGTATISATLNSIQGATTLVVTPAALVSIAVAPINPSIPLGTKQPFTAMGTFADGSSQDLTASATWSSDTPSAATVNAAGLATSTGQGTATITATVGSVSGSSVLTVTPAALVSIAVNPQTATAPVGTTQTFTATGTYTDGSTQDVTQSGHWSSSNGTSATVSNTPGSQGLASALATGATSISVTQNGVSGTANLNVSPAALVSITLAPLAPTITLGASQQFSATGTFTDGTTQDVTSVVQWTSTPVSVAVINTTGLATSASPGNATITAASGSVTQSTTLTVGAPACPNFYPVDLFLNMNGMPLGSSVTTTSLGAGTEISANYGGWYAASPSQTFGPSQVAMPAGVTVNGGATHSCTYATQSLAHAATGNFTVSSINMENKTPTQLVIGGWIINTPPNQGTHGYLFDLAQTVGNHSYAATIQVDSGTNQVQACSTYAIEIESSGGKTVHSPCNTAIVPGGTYFVQMHVNYTAVGSCNFGTVVAPCAELNVYSTSGSTFTQVGSTVAVALGGTDNTAGISLGNNEQGTFTGTIYFQNWMVDYTHSQFPNLPH